MSLIICPECNSNVSTLAKACPQCGHPLTSDSLKFDFAIPAIPEEIHRGLKKADLGGRGFLKWHVGVGEWVKEGQEIARYNVKSFKAGHFQSGKIDTKASIDAPITGYISKINSIEYSKWNLNNDENQDHLKKIASYSIFEQLKMNICLRLTQHMKIL